MRPLLVQVGPSQLGLRPPLPRLPVSIMTALISTITGCCTADMRCGPCLPALECSRHWLPLLAMLPAAAAAPAVLCPCQLLNSTPSSPTTAAIPALPGPTATLRLALSPLATVPCIVMGCRMLALPRVAARPCTRVATQAVVAKQRCSQRGTQHARWPAALGAWLG